MHGSACALHYQLVGHDNDAESFHAKWPSLHTDPFSISFKKGYGSLYYCGNPRLSLAKTFFFVSAMAAILNLLSVANTRLAKIGKNKM